MSIPVFINSNWIIFGWYLWWWFFEWAKISPSWQMLKLLQIIFYRNTNFSMQGLQFPKGAKAEAQKDTILSPGIPSPPFLLHLLTGNGNGAFAPQTLSQDMLYFFLPQADFSLYFRSLSPLNRRKNKVILPFLLCSCSTWNRKSIFCHTKVKAKLQRATFCWIPKLDPPVTKVVIKIKPLETQTLFSCRRSGGSEVHRSISTQPSGSGYPHPKIHVPAQTQSPVAWSWRVHTHRCVKWLKIRDKKHRLWLKNQGIISKINYINF